MTAKDAVRLRLVVPAEARVGRPVPLTLRVENTSDGAIDLYLRGREIAFDVVVSRTDGGVVWRRLEGEVIPAIIQLKTLPPREALELRAEWNQRTNQSRRAGPGLYSVRGVLLTDAPTPLETAAVELRIVPD
jgi:hypothetical protein